ncbi:uveal autoantigen with coiled-coil domains and ankyrin repeats protein-like isoform X1 [Xyrauchen texanus]|uniref:uveal autoantigen with coiled-coil domains and ankyrin repeats protein-like isoform X1 n=1 Tax=Xyrauchen texanus TaxID=154827 RepID=UPI002241EC62|nr:uveal autoantigen with coiled-coil domains and ankyrin repeats protein-like isoform X1 [Xyrauchen texanus]
MKSFKQRLKKNESTEWGKQDERLMKAVENGDIDKVTAILKKGANPTRLDPEGHSAFHVAASKGLINSLNVFLDNSVDVKAVDAAGKTALHLAAGGGHSMCVQKLLQCKCPVDSTDLQGRTALHDAAYVGCKAVIKMLCDSGACIDALDADSRSPLLLAAKMCQPGACQLLVQYGAHTILRDKQNKTALILACENSCKEAVEILLKTNADMSALDIYGHDAYHYSRLSQNQDLITLVKHALEAGTKAKEISTVPQKIQQAKSSSGGIGWTKSGAVKMENVLSEPITVRHAQFAPAPVRSATISEDLLPGEVEALRRELRESRKRHEAAEAEVHRMDTALALRSQEYEGLRRNSEQALHAAHSRVWELEEALGEVQRRMAGSETRVRQMQAHLVAVREHLVEELRVQLQEAKGQRHAAVAELGRMQMELSQSMREVEQQKENQSPLMQELSRLSQKLLSREEQINTLRARIATVEAQQAEMLCKEAQTPSEWCPTDAKITMTDLITETCEPTIDLDRYISKAEHVAATSLLNNALQQAEVRAEEALQKYQCALEDNQSLLRELHEQKTELDTIQEALQARCVPVALVEEKEKEVEQLRLALEEMEKRKNQGSVNFSPREEGDARVLSEECTVEIPSEIQYNQVSSSNESDKAECDVIRIAEKKILPTEISTISEDQQSTSSDQVVKNSELLVEHAGQRGAQGSFSEPSHSDSSLQAQVNRLQLQLEASEKHYRNVLSIYRTRLLSAAQGFMDEEARVALLQIVKMRECVC